LKWSSSINAEFNAWFVLSRGAVATAMQTGYLAHFVTRKASTFRRGFANNILHQFTITAPVRVLRHIDSSQAKESRDVRQYILYMIFPVPNAIRGTMAEITLLMIAGDSGLVFLADQGASVLDRIFVVANQIARRPESMQQGTHHGQQSRDRTARPGGGGIVGGRAVAIMRWRT